MLPFPYCAPPESMSSETRSVFRPGLAHSKFPFLLTHYPLLSYLIGSSQGSHSLLVVRDDDKFFGYSPTGDGALGTAPCLALALASR